MAEADGPGRRLGDPDDGLTCLRAVGVERSQHHARGAIGNGVAGEQDAGGREPQRDAAVGVPGCRDDVRTAAELNGVTVGQLGVNRTGRDARWNGGDPLIQRPARRR